MKKTFGPEQVPEEIVNAAAENRSTKRQKVLLLAACLFLLLQTAVYAALLIRDGRQDRAETKELLIPQTADEITGITFRAQDRTVLSFALKDGQWSLDEARCDFSGALPGTLPDDWESAKENISQGAVRVLASGVTGIAVRGVIEDPEDLSQYGLAEPFTEAEIRMKDGSAVRLAVSDTAQSASAVYAVLDGDVSKVYICVPSLKSAFEKEFRDFTAS